MASALAFADPETVVEFNPDDPGSLDWKIVNDGVMGGLSKGTFEISRRGILTFEGDLSLRNNGGFSSLRSNKTSLDLGDADGVRLRVKGDGRTYQVRFNTDARFRGMEVSFKADFKTSEGEWTEVEVPFTRFVGSFRGMTLENEKFDPARIRRIGLLLADKKAGPFRVEVDWIRPYQKDGTLDSSDAKDIVSLALADGRFQTLAKALGEAKLVDALQGKGPLTVFAPTDEAFARLPENVLTSLLEPENREKLQSILTYHVVPGAVDLASALAAKEAKTLEGSPVRISFSEGRVKVNEASLIDADIRAANGVIHVIDSVILPPEPSNTLLDVARRSGTFTTLLAAMEAAGLSDSLKGEEPLTVFAPTDKAFEALPQGTLEALLEPGNRKKLAKLLAMHAVPGKVSAGDALNAGKATPLGKQDLQFHITNGLFQVNGITILKTDIACDNGVIHVIDGVLLPESANQAVTETAGSAREQIESAIEKGVPIFNAGDHGQCADIYRDCMISMVEGEKVSGKLQERMRKWIKQSSGIKNDTDRAWMLRRGLDHVYGTL